MKIKFWGTRGSIAAPLRPEEVTAKLRRVILGLPDLDTHDERAVDDYLAQLPPLTRGTAGGNTPCVEVRSGDVLLVMDAGTGLRELGSELMRREFGRGAGTLHLFISHAHWDHIQGFPSFIPAFIPGNRIFIYGFHDLRTAFDVQQYPLTWPVSLQYMSATIEFVPWTLGVPMVVGGVRVEALRNHHPGASYSYRISDDHGTAVYATDVEYKQLDEVGVQQYIDFFRQADALIFDAQYTLRDAWKREDWGHSSAMIGVDLARAAGVKQLLLFHHDPSYSDEELEQVLDNALTYQAQDAGRASFEIGIAYEGLVVDLDPERAIDRHLAPDGDTAILTSARVFDELSVELVARQLEEAGGNSIIDLSQVEKLTTGGVRALVTLQQKQPGLRDLALIAPSEQVRQVIRLAGYQDCFAVYPTVQAALAAVAARDAARLPGQVIGRRYQIEARLGENELGTVLQVLDLMTQENCVLRLLAPTFSAETIDGVFQEAPQLLRLDHPNLVKVRAWEHHDRLAYVVEELPDAPTLEALLTDLNRALSIDQAEALLFDLSRALEYAHSRGVVHGDLNPGNIYVLETGAEVGGFGMGRLVEGRHLLEIPVLVQDPAYLAPEQILGQPIDARTDLYALGVILYRLFTGRLPFEGTPTQVLEGHLHRAPMRPGLLNGELSPSLEHLVMKLLAKNPNERYASSQQTRRISASLLTRDEVSGPRPLVEREQPLQVLLECWNEARQGKGQLAFITGEPGIGKTTLAQQAAAASGAAVLLVGSGEEREGTPAYYMFTQVLRSYLATVPPELWDRQMRQLLGNFMVLIPELSQMLPDVEPPPPLEPAQEQLRLMGSLTRFIKRATRERPWFLILDDLQWAERSSLELLRYLGRHLSSIALMLVGTYRDSDLTPDHPLRETLRALNHDSSYRVLSLDRLDVAGVKELLENLWHQPVPAAFVAKIYQHTAGNPFFVEEVAKALLDEGRITLKEGQLYFPADLRTIVFPTSVRETVLHRVGLLPEETQSLLRQAAVLGQSFHYLDLQEMSGLSEWEMLERLEPALERQLVQEASGEGLLRFRHFEIHQVLYGELSPLRRRLSHRQAGEALERRLGPLPGVRVEELAHHFGRAGEEAKSITYGLQAARTAHQAYALDTALLWYNRALERVRFLPVKNPALELEIRHELGRVLIVVNRYDEALEHCNAAWELLNQHPEPDQDVARAGFCYLTAQVYERSSEYTLALKWVHKGLAYLDDLEETSELVQLYYLWGLVLFRLSNIREGVPHLVQALELAQKLHLQSAEADMLRALGAVFWQLNEMDRALHYSEQALALYRELGDRYGECRTLNNFGVFYVRTRCYDEAQLRYEQALGIYQEIGDRAGAGGVFHNLALIVWDHGDLKRAQFYGRQALELLQGGHDRFGEAAALGSLGEICMNYGDYPLAVDYFTQALGIRRQIGDRSGEVNSLSGLGMLALYQGNWESALDGLLQAVQIAREVEFRYESSCALIYLASYYAWHGDVASAGELWRDVLEAEADGAYPGVLARARAGQAEFWLMQGEIDRALMSVEPILIMLQEPVQRYADGPFVIYWICCRILQAAGDVRLEMVLEEAHNLLMTWAARMDEAMRKLFLEQVSVNRELWQWWHKGQPGNDVTL